MMTIQWYIIYGGILLYELYWFFEILAEHDALVEEGKVDDDNTIV